MTIIKINNKYVRIPNKYRLLKEDVKMVPGDRVLNVYTRHWEDVDVFASEGDDADVGHTPKEMRYIAVIRKENTTHPQDFNQEGLYVTDEFCFEMERCINF